MIGKSSARSFREKIRFFWKPHTGKSNHSTNHRAFFVQFLSNVSKLHTQKSASNSGQANQNQAVFVVFVWIIFLLEYLFLLEINRKMVDTIWFWLAEPELEVDFCVCSFLVFQFTQINFYFAQAFWNVCENNIYMYIFVWKHDFGSILIKQIYGKIPIITQDWILFITNAINLYDE